MGEVMEIIGRTLAVRKNFTKEQLKTVEMMIADGIVWKWTRKGSATVFELTKKGKQLYNLTH